MGGVIGETLIVRAIVPEELREQFEIWYQEEHIPEAHKAFGSYQAHRGWSLENPEAHFAVYRFNNVGAVNEITLNGVLETLRLVSELLPFRVSQFKLSGLCHTAIRNTMTVCNKFGN